MTPRDDLAILLEHVARSAPLAILLDVDLAYSDGSDGKALKDFLENYKNTWPPLLLVRSLVRGPDDRLPQPRTTKYDAVVGPRMVDGQLVPAKENVMFTSPLFERDGDGKVRRWKLFAKACDGKAPIVVPSMHLAAAMIARHSITARPPTDAGPPLMRMMRVLAAFTPANCEEANGEREGVLDRLPEDRPIKIEKDDVSKRVIYRVAWRPNAVGLGPFVDEAGCRRRRRDPTRRGAPSTSGRSGRPKRAVGRSRRENRRDRGKLFRAGATATTRHLGSCRGR